MHRKKINTIKINIMMYNAGNRDITALQVKCRNVVRECKWVGTVGTLEEHVAKCEFTMLFCPNECEDDEDEITHFMRKDLDKHLETECPCRDHECEHCGVKGMYENITQVHDKKCEKKIVPCPNDDCIITIERRLTKRHLEECGYSKIPCKYQKMGCGVKMMRKDLPKHEDDEDKLHLHKALDKVIELRDFIEESITTLGEDCSWTFRVKEFQNMKDNERFFSSSFYSSPNGYHMQVKVHANGVGDGKGTHVSVYVHMLEGKYDAELNWPFTGNITIEILNQLKDNSHHKKNLSLTKEETISIGGKKGYSKFISHEKLTYDHFKYPRYLKNDTLYFKVSVNIPDHVHKPWLQCIDWN